MAGRADCLWPGRHYGPYAARRLRGDLCRRPPAHTVAARSTRTVDPDGRIRFLPNRFDTNWRGRLLERAFVTAPRLGIAYHVARSLFS